MQERLEPLRTERGELSLAIFSADTISIIWGEIEPMLQRSIDITNGMQTIELVKAEIDNKEAVCFAPIRDGKIEAVIVCRVVEYATYRAARIIACAGENLKEAMQFIEAIDAWARSHNCYEIECWCVNPAMARLVRGLGWKPKFTALTRDLRRKLQ